jgi:hypothetical protein
MDWTKQAEDMLKTWTSSQQAMWDSWMKTMQGFGGSQPNDAWEKSIETWRDSVKRALDAQVAWAQFWADSMTSGPGANKQASELSEQLLDMTKRWTETQNKMWDNWFETMKKTDPSTMAQSWNTEDVQKIVQTWQEATQKAMEAQMEWSRMWAAMQKQQDAK